MGWIVNIASHPGEKRVPFPIRQFAKLLADYAPSDQLAGRRNVGRYDYGIKGFMLSMIETAIEVTEGRIPASCIGRIIGAGHEMPVHPVEQPDQERKLAQSGLGGPFVGVEIVSAKTAAVCSGIFERCGAEPRQAMMVGNSMRSDVVPAIEAGDRGILIPHDLTCTLVQGSAPKGHPRYCEPPAPGALPALIDWIEGNWPRAWRMLGRPKKSPQHVAGATSIMHRKSLKSGGGFPAEDIMLP